MSLAVQVVFTGLSAGGVYGLVAIGYSLLYRLTGIVYFALGDLIGLGAFVTLLVAAGTEPLTQETVSGGRTALAILAGIAVCVTVGAGGYFAVVQPYIGRSASRFTPSSTRRSHVRRTSFQTRSCFGGSATTDW